jgi:hypothetical protein
MLQKIASNWLTDQWNKGTTKLNSLWRSLYGGDANEQRDIDDLYSDVFKLMGKNQPYKPYDFSKLKKGDTINIAFSGAADGSERSPQGVYRNTFSDFNQPVAMYRFNDIEQADKDVKELKRRGVNIRVFGHSWGASGANTVASNNRINDVVLLDPVKRGDFKINKGTIVYLPADTRNTVWNNLVAKIGGRVDTTKYNPIKVDGDHMSMVRNGVKHYFESKGFYPKFGSQSAH